MQMRLVVDLQTRVRPASSRAHADLSRFIAIPPVHHSRVNAAITEFKLPAMSPTMTEGSVGEWKFKEGEAFSASDVLMTVETDKGAVQLATLRADIRELTP